MTMSGYRSLRVSQIENAYLVEVQDEDYGWKQYSFNSIDNIIEKIQEVFKANGR